MNFQKILSNTISLVLSLVLFVSTSGYAQADPPACSLYNATYRVDAQNDTMGIEAIITWTNPNLNTSFNNAFSYHRVMIWNQAQNAYGMKYVELGWMKSNKFTASPNRFRVVLAFMGRVKQPDGTYKFTPLNIALPNKFGELDPGHHRYTIIQEKFGSVDAHGLYVDGIFQNYIPRTADNQTADVLIQSGFVKGDKAIVGSETCHGLEDTNYSYFYNIAYKRQLGWLLWPNPSLMYWMHFPYGTIIQPNPLFSFSVYRTP